MIQIRKSEVKDLADITRIYNEAIKNTVATFDTEIKSVDQMRKWYDTHGLKNPIIVASKDNLVVGWAALSKYSTRCAYSDTAEISVYVLEEYQGSGIGTKLMEEIINEGGKAGIHTIIARIVAGNKISIKMHETYGFFHVGILKEVGCKFGKILDVYLMQKIYK